MYVCLEGIDGSGKSTQITMLGKWLEDFGYEVFRVSEPTDSEVGRLIRKMLKNPQVTDEKFQNTLALLFAADRMVLMDDIRRAETEKKMVISDRCFFSSVVYQNDDKWIYEINKHVKKPDVVLLLDLDPETSLKRCEGKDHFENRVFLEKIRERYLKLVETEGFYVINAENGINKIQDDIRRVISPKIGRCI
jgi:dTMP kinase